MGGGQTSKSTSCNVTGDESMHLSVTYNVSKRTSLNIRPFEHLIVSPPCRIVG